MLLHVRYSTGGWEVRYRPGPTHTIEAAAAVEASKRPTEGTKGTRQKPRANQGGRAHPGWLSSAAQEGDDQ